MNKIPEKIYLNIEPDSPTYLCWDENRQNESDIEYIRKTDKKLTYFTQEEIDESLNALIELEKQNEDMMAVMIQQYEICMSPPVEMLRARHLSNKLEQIKQKLHREDGMAYKYLVSVLWNKSKTDLIIPLNAKNHDEIIQHFYNMGRPLSEARYFHIYKLEKLKLDHMIDKN